MIRKIFRKFGYISIAEHVEGLQILHKENKDLKEGNRSIKLENEALKGDNFSLKLKVASFQETEKTKFPVDISLGDPTPQDSEDRKAYVAKTAAFFKEVLEPKLEFMISYTHVMFEEESNSRELDLILKGVTYSFRELIKWGNVMVNEQVANQNTNVLEGDVEQIKELIK